MFLQPKQLKFKKLKKGKLIKYNFKPNFLKFGTIGLKASEAGLISNRQIEAARQAIVRKIKRNGKIWIRIFPHYPVTKKPTEIRMGKGKGNTLYWSSKVSGGTVLFEIAGVNKNIAISAFKTGAAKLPIKTVIFD